MNVIQEQFHESRFIGYQITLLFQVVYVYKCKKFIKSLNNI